MQKSLRIIQDNSGLVMQLHNRRTWTRLSCFDPLLCLKEGDLPHNSLKNQNNVTQYPGAPGFILKRINHIGIVHIVFLPHSPTRQLRVFGLCLVREINTTPPSHYLLLVSATDAWVFITSFYLFGRGLPLPMTLM